MSMACSRLEKQPVADVSTLFRRGHYQRALEEALHTHASQWPKSWDGKNPLRGGKTFASMDAPERVSMDRWIQYDRHLLTLAINIAQSYEDFDPLGTFLI